MQLTETDVMACKKCSMQNDKEAIKEYKGSDKGKW